MKAFLSILLSFQSAFANEAELFDAGTKLLRAETSAEDFLTHARTVRASREFTVPEKEFLVDLGRKSTVVRELCPSVSEGLCAPVNAATAFEPVPMMEPVQTTDDPGWSRPLQWGIAIGLIVLAGSSAMKGRELVIHRP